MVERGEGGGRIEMQGACANAANTRLQTSALPTDRSIDESAAGRRLLKRELPTQGLQLESRTQRDEEHSHTYVRRRCVS